MTRPIIAVTDSVFPSLDPAMKFYRDILGFQEGPMFPSFRAGEVGLDDQQPHVIAWNTWKGTGIPPAPAHAHQVSLYLAGQWRTLQFRPELTAASTPLERLDVSLLQKHVLEPLFGIDNPRTSHRIGFVGGIRGTVELERLVDGGDYACAAGRGESLSGMRLHARAVAHGARRSGVVASGLKGQPTRW